MYVHVHVQVYTCTCTGIYMYIHVHTCIRCLFECCVCDMDIGVFSHCRGCNGEDRRYEVSVIVVQLVETEVVKTSIPITRGVNRKHT